MSYLLLNGSKIGDLLIISVNLLRVLFFLIKLDGPGLLRLLEEDIEAVSSASEETLTFDLLEVTFSVITESSSVIVSSFKNSNFLRKLYS